MTAKKKLIRIEPVPEVFSGTYAPTLNSSKPVFGFVGPTEEVRDDIKYRKQVSTFFGCREQLCEVPRCFIHKADRMSSGSYQVKNALDMDRLRLLIGVSSNLGDTKQRFFSAKRIINILEESAGWDTSVITSVKHTKFTKDEHKLFLVTGCDKWIKYPQMLSFLCLVFRLAYHNGPFNVENLDDVNKVFKDLAKKPENQRTTDDNYIAGARKHILTLMQNLEKVFEGPIETYYPDPNKNDPGWGGYGGITSLMQCSTGNKELHERLKKYVFEKSNKGE